MTQHVPAVKTDRAKRVLGMHANGLSYRLIVGNLGLSGETP